MILLYANVIIWWMAGDRRLGAEARELLARSDVDLSVCLLNLFEIELKARINKLSLTAPVSDFLDEFGIDVYSPTANELTSMMSIKLNHSDPFDCALIGLAKLKGWTVMTSDGPLQKASSDLVTFIDSRK
jgi:PIN domain nuclease of toxin-antitoxin system